MGENEKRRKFKVRKVNCIVIRLPLIYIYMRGTIKKVIYNLDGMSTVSKFACLIFDACFMFVSAPEVLHSGALIFIFLIKLSILRDLKDYNPSHTYVLSLGCVFLKQISFFQG